MTTRRNSTATPAPGASSAAATLVQIKTRLTTEVDDLREQIAEARERLEAVESGALPKAEVIERMTQWIDTQAAEFGKEAAFGVSGLRLQRPEPPTLLQVAVRGGLHPEGPVAAADLTALLAWLLGDTLKKKGLSYGSCGQGV